MYSKILVPLDGSKRAEAILQHVEELARRYEAKVIFLHVVEAVPLMVEPEYAYVAVRQDVLEQRKRQAETYLVTLQAEFQARGVDVVTRVAYGPVVEAILDAAEREGANLIAMASHGRSGLTQVFYGSVAAGILHRVDRPLLLVRSREAD